MIPLAYESFWAKEKVLNWERKNTVQKLSACLKYKFFGGNRLSPTANERRLYELSSQNVQIANNKGGEDNDK